MLQIIRKFSLFYIWCQFNLKLIRGSEGPLPVRLVHKRQDRKQYSLYMLRNHPRVAIILPYLIIDVIQCYSWFYHYIPVHSVGSSCISRIRYTRLTPHTTYRTDTFSLIEPIGESKSRNSLNCKVWVQYFQRLMIIGLKSEHFMIWNN